MAIIKYLNKNYKNGTIKKYKRCQHIIKKRYKKKERQCNLPVIIGDYCHRHINQSTK